MTINLEIPDESVCLSVTVMYDVGGMLYAKADLTDPRKLKNVVINKKGVIEDDD